MKQFIFYFLILVIFMFGVAKSETQSNSNNEKFMQTQIQQKHVSNFQVQKLLD